MSSDYTVSATVRADVGKGASRRLRRLEGEIPAIVYGGEKAPQMLNLIHKDLIRLLNDEAFYTSILTLDVDGQKESVVLKDLQRHPAKLRVLHADFLRVNADTPITLHVPLHFLNEDICVGVKLQGGNITHAATDIEVQCLPKDLPEFIEVDMAKIETGTTLHISDLVLPAGVSSTALALGEDHDQAIATVHAPRGASSDDEDEAEASDAE
ncbi:MAG: large subunit ribosomal protein L25 [Zhongshania aliphaticivorans]|jgi:large subunit ribosomal protein L25|uniref:Large ribosomal subunit protein bL25 n=1 Tax=Zhongshania aliphaticivorans TaxID=1470434 RepID=A0A127M8H7_9GAMM|nr:50S ribosomal protein L25/general stress protein Ctc [Zhongshania aliphaticivorans]AMO69512.1 50S ribosomal protein L25/general stress protein Ctc [Zhongshania aliphaticivorans]EIF42157.1 50S ribosomal protein L25/general stress protein Ctc [gamma proteobacterium BDW918]